MFSEANTVNIGKSDSTDSAGDLVGIVKSVTLADCTELQN